MIFDVGHKRTDDIIAEIEKRVGEEYAQAAKEVDEKFRDYMKQFERKNKRKLKQLASGQITHAEYIDWWYKQLCTGRRWMDLRDQLAADLVNKNLIARSIIQGYMPEVYALNHNFAVYQVEHDALIDTSFTLYNRRAVENLIRDDDNLLPYPRKDSPTAKKLIERPDLIWHRRKIHSAITQGVLQGESIPQISERLKRVVGMDHVAAVRNARTMMTAVENKARVDAYDEIRELGVELREMWVATLDQRTRNSHRHLHGTYKDPETGEYANGLQYPADPNGDPEEVYNCRCCEVCEIGSIRMDVPRHSERMNGMSFDEWLDAKPITKPTPKPKRERG